MKKNIQLQLLPSEVSNAAIIRSHISEAIGEKESRVNGFNIIKRSIDARSRQPKIILTVEAFIDEPFQPRTIQTIHFPDTGKSLHSVIIVGAGPAGLFAALRLIQCGIRPIIIERGKNVRARRRDLALLNKEGQINPESNYCFGEGGAGTYSDGKLYTRSTKRGSVERILNLFVQFGADENILSEAHPHIGTNKLPSIISAMREQIETSGGKLLFEKKLSALLIENNQIVSVTSSDGDTLPAQAVILATGHSARDIFHLLDHHKILIEAKPFALGVRIEHPQELIDSVQYHKVPGNVTGKDQWSFLPPASYSLVEQINERGVFSFCMCPGGIIAPASTSPGELVVNGWSPSKRNNPFANSGIVVNIEEKDLNAFSKFGALAGVHFQAEVEKKAYELGGGKFVAPAQRMADFVDNRLSADLPSCSYLPGIHSTSIKKVLPHFVGESLAKAFKTFGKKLKGYYTNEAVIVATESRTSSPVRIPRDHEKLHHPQVLNLFPCGEGAGYAGGIVSAAMDGEKIANAIAKKFGQPIPPAIDKNHSF